MAHLCSIFYYVFFSGSLDKSSLILTTILVMFLLLLSSTLSSRSLQKNTAHLHSVHIRSHCPLLQTEFQLTIQLWTLPTCMYSYSSHGLVRAFDWSCLLVCVLPSPGRNTKYRINWGLYSHTGLSAGYCHWFLENGVPSEMPYHRHGNQWSGTWPGNLMLCIGLCSLCTYAFWKSAQVVKSFHCSGIVTLIILLFLKNWYVIH